MCVLAYLHACMTNSLACAVASEREPVDVEAVAEEEEESSDAAEDDGEVFENNTNSKGYPRFAGKVPRHVQQTLRREPGFGSGYSAMNCTLHNIHPVSVSRSSSSSNTSPSSRSSPSARSSTSSAAVGTAERPSRLARVAPGQTTDDESDESDE